MVAGHIERVKREGYTIVENAIPADLVEALNDAGDDLFRRAEIFNNFDRQNEARFIDALEERNREAAERIRAMLSRLELRLGHRPLKLTVSIGVAVQRGDLRVHRDIDKSGTRNKSSRSSRSKCLSRSICTS